MDDVRAQLDHSAYTDRERHLAEWFNVNPKLIRELTDVAARIRQTNVTRSSSGLFDEQPEPASFSVERRRCRGLRRKIWWR